MPRVVLAMSGGVDSGVPIRYLVDAGASRRWGRYPDHEWADQYGEPTLVRGETE